MRTSQHLRSAFTFVEVLVAVVILSVALLALAASGTMAIRQIYDDNLALRAATRSQRYAEQQFSLPCHADALADSSQGIRIVASVAPGDATTEVDLASTYTTRRAKRTELYTFLGGCY